MLSCDTKAEHNLGFVISRMMGYEVSRGWITYYPRLDPAHLLNLCSKIQVSIEDERVKDLINFIHHLQGENGQWEWKLHPQANCLLTYDLLYSLKSMNDTVDWVSHEPITPFREYSKKLKRF